MFWYIKGKVLSSDGIILTVLVDNTGLWLEILASPNLILEASQKQIIEAHIHHHITEVSQTLFGFVNENEKQLFKNLLKVNGIGWKTALNMLWLWEEALLKAIQDEDDTILSSVPGIGKKTAQKIIVDLKWSIQLDKVSAGSTQQKTSTPSPLVSSLISMWYDKNRVEEVIAKLDTSLPLAEQVKIAIKNLA